MISSEHATKPPVMQIWCLTQKLTLSRKHGHWASSPAVVNTCRRQERDHLCKHCGRHTRTGGGEESYLLRDSSEGHGVGHKWLTKSQSLSFIHVLQGDTEHQLVIIAAKKDGTKSRRNTAFWEWKEHRTNRRGSTMPTVGCGLWLWLLREYGSYRTQSLQGIPFSTYKSTWGNVKWLHINSHYSKLMNLQCHLAP